jgi:hypothetical protein
MTCIMSVAHVVRGLSRMQFREAAQHTFFLMLSARDQYREACTRLGVVRHPLAIVPILWHVQTRPCCAFCLLASWHGSLRVLSAHLFFPLLQPMHAGVVRHFAECHVVALAPICPHFCDHVWRTFLGGTVSVFQTRWPVVEPPHEEFIRQECVLYRQLLQSRG